MNERQKDWIGHRLREHPMATLDQACLKGRKKKFSVLQIYHARIPAIRQHCSERPLTPLFTVAYTDAPGSAPTSNE
jgi:hypothetical protein